MVRGRTSSESFQRKPDVLDLGRRGEAISDELAPGLEVLGLAEVPGVVLERLPFDEEAVAARLLVRALQLHALAAASAAEKLACLCDPGFEFMLQAGLHLDLGNLENHRVALPAIELEHFLDEWT